MTDASPTTKSRSSVLYALGRLEAQNEEQRREIRELPEQIASLFTPRLVAIEGTLGDHSKRLAVVERRWWILIGAVGAITTLAEGWSYLHHG
jgi:hypothetical protein